MNTLISNVQKTTLTATPDTTQTGLFFSCVVWRCELSLPDRPTSAFRVGVCRAAQALPVRPPDALRRKTHLSVNSHWFGIKKGVRQGCVLSKLLFNILVETGIRKTVDGFQGGLQIGGRMVTNLRYADDIILLATSQAELQESVDRLDRLSRKYSLLRYTTLTRPR